MPPKISARRNPAQLKTRRERVTASDNCHRPRMDEDSGVNSAPLTPFAPLPSNIPLRLSTGSSFLLLDPSLNLRAPGFPYESQASLMCFSANSELGSTERTAPLAQDFSKALAETIYWVHSEDRASNILWLRGPGGSGRTAPTKVVGEWSEKGGFLGAPLFSVHNAQVVEHKHLIEAQVIVGPFLLGRLPPTFMRKPIIKLLLVLSHQYKLPIIIDELDMSQGGRHSSIASLIDRAFCPSEPHSPFLRMISHWHKPHPRGRDWRVHLETFLRKYFMHIKDLFPVGSSYPYAEIGRDWPSDLDFEQVLDGACGFPVFAPTLIKFISDPIHGDPYSKFRAIIANLADTTDYVYDRFQALFQTILASIPHSSLPIVIQLLAVHASDSSLPALHLANLLGLDQSTFYHSLSHVRSIVDAPSHELAPTEPLRLFHDSFSSLFLTICKQGVLGFTGNVIWSKISAACFHVLSRTRIPYSRSLSWKSTPSTAENHCEQDLLVSHRLSAFAAMHAWGFCMRIETPASKFVHNILANFDFRTLQYVSGLISVQDFLGFILWLYRSTNPNSPLHSIVRVMGSSELDNELIKKCRAIARPLVLEVEARETILAGSPHYVLLGYGVKTVIVILIHEAVTFYSKECLDHM